VRSVRWPFVAVAGLVLGGAWLGRDRLAYGLATLWSVAPAPPVVELARGAGAPAAAVAAETPVAVRWVDVATGLERPVLVTHAGDGSGRLFVVEQPGRIRILRDGRLLERPFLDARGLLDESSGERGLLGLAFPPDFRRTGEFFVAHTGPGPSNRVTRMKVSAGDPDRADPASAETVLSIRDPAHNHNGGGIVFGPDGYLWVGTGDGGSAGDPWDNARDRGELLGKMLRLDVRRRPYAVPPDNPFVGRSGARGEIWALGLRNPWRFSFDRATGELWIGDVGQNAWEEIDVEDPKTGGGHHYGWKTLEARHCFDPRRGCESDGTRLPMHEYGRDAGCSVTGGHVYRGRALPALAGRYLFADYCTGTVWALARRPEGPPEVAVLLASRRSISSFGEDEAGEIYLCDHLGGAVGRLEAVPEAPERGAATPAGPADVDGAGNGEIEGRRG
jgi:glucose/arabinose dehydrogenase